MRAMPNAPPAGNALVTFDAQLAKQQEEAQLATGCESCFRWAVSSAWKRRGSSS